MFAPDAKSVVAQIAFISPAISSVPDVDNEFDFVLVKTALMPANFCADDELSCTVDAAVSPAVAFIIALTSAAVLGITSIFRLLKSCNWSDARPSARSRDLMSVSFEEHTHRRYVSSCFAQN